MIVTAWNNGQYKETGAGYGVKLNAADRDKCFSKDWDKITLYMEGRDDSIEVNVNKPSFWGPVCRELIHKEIGRWLQNNDLAPWEKGNPPKMKMEQVKENVFRLSLPLQ